MDEILTYLHDFQKCSEIDSCEDCSATNTCGNYGIEWCEVFRGIFSDVREKLDVILCEIM